LTSESPCCLPIKTQSYVRRQTSTVCWNRFQRGWSRRYSLLCHE